MRMTQVHAEKHKPAVKEDLPDLELEELENEVRIDAILDEIDDVLEENAELFVQSYVQQGGQ